jgi:hypothetical protein
MYKQRLARALVGALLVAAPLAAATSAGAETNVGKVGTESRCAKANYNLCLYWGNTTTAYWPANKSVFDLTGHNFWSGTGTGAGTHVKDNAETFYCGDWWLCSFFAEAGYKGASDFAERDEGKDMAGPLSSTYNQIGSVGLPYN